MKKSLTVIIPTLGQFRNDSPHLKRLRNLYFQFTKFRDQKWQYMDLIQNRLSINHREFKILMDQKLVFTFFLGFILMFEQILDFFGGLYRIVEVV